jgi:hypothetical protein
VPEILEFKEYLQKFAEKGEVVSWELPYENILSRISAAYFFLSLEKNINEEHFFEEVKKSYPITYSSNADKKLSQLDWEIKFND